MANEVALLAEGVDRNLPLSVRLPSPSVALLAEGVDRNSSALTGTTPAIRSPSSRRAWIEMDQGVLVGVALDVALLAEGVDRNMSSLYSGASSAGRPPRGGRG